MDIGLPNINLPAARNFAPTTNPFLISFTQSQSQAAFSLVTNPGTSTFDALLNNSVVDTFSTATNTTSSNNFYGFTGVTFDAIRVTAALNGIAVIDNIQLGTATAQSVPEPFSPHSALQLLRHILVTKTRQFDDTTDRNSLIPVTQN